MSFLITSLHNPRVKRAIALRAAKWRLRESRYLIDGGRELHRAIAAGSRIEEVFVCPSLCQNDECRRVLSALESLAAHVYQVTPAVFEKLAFGNRMEGVLGVGVTPNTKLDQLAIPDHGIVGVIVGVEKPGNLGAVLRSADGAGVSAMIIADGISDLFNPNCIRASLGTVFTMPLATAPATEVLCWLRERAMPTYAARPDAALDYRQVQLADPAAIVLGSEATGLSALWDGDGITSIRIPMLGAADSLNISATAAILFYEALRQQTIARGRV